MPPASKSVQKQGGASKSVQKRGGASKFVAYLTRLFEAWFQYFGSANHASDRPATVAAKKPSVPRTMPKQKLPPKKKLPNKQKLPKKKQKLPPLGEQAYGVSARTWLFCEVDEPPEEWDREPALAEVWKLEGVNFPGVGVLFPAGRYNYCKIMHPLGLSFSFSVNNERAAAGTLRPEILKALRTWAAEHVRACPGARRVHGTYPGVRVHTHCETCIAARELQEDGEDV